MRVSYKLSFVSDTDFFFYCSLESRVFLQTLFLLFECPIFYTKEPYCAPANSSLRGYCYVLIHTLRGIKLFLLKCVSQLSDVCK